MRLLDLVARAAVPAPWAEGDNIPWHEPGFSERMLAEHLSQAHDAASRRTPAIAAQVRWIHEQVLHGRPARVLDLGCGPGLYCSALARLGHECTGIDYSPASIAYATEHAACESLRCAYILGDLRTTPFGHGYDLVMLIYGELNVFSPADAARLLRSAHDALSTGGTLLLEAHTFDAVRSMGQAPRVWSTAERGLFSTWPYLLLQEHFWDETSATATIRYFVVDAGTAEVTRYAQTLQAYTDAAYHDLLGACGFSEVRMHPPGGANPFSTLGLLALTARRP